MKTSIALLSILISAFSAVSAFPILSPLLDTTPQTHTLERRMFRTGNHELNEGSLNVEGTNSGIRKTPTTSSSRKLRPLFVHNKKELSATLSTAKISGEVFTVHDRDGDIEIVEGKVVTFGKASLTQYGSIDEGWFKVVRVQDQNSGSGFKYYSQPPPELSVVPGKLESAYMLQYVVAPEADAA